ncbi:MAG: amidohydrolase [Saprospiraceae bacterium]
MRVTLVQTALHWENPAANRDTLSQKLARLAGQTDLVILPEMFSTGFSMNAAALAEPMEGPTVDWLRTTAHTLGAAVTGSFICTADGHFFNRLIWMYPDGRYEVYDKRHLFGLAGENLIYSAGKKRLIVEWLGWRICPLICYDLRFPAWSRNQIVGQKAKKNSAYDLLIFVANWPERRSHHWRSLLTARAIENQSFTIGVNVIGQDGNGQEYLGDSTLLDFAGQSIFQISRQECVFTTKLLLDNLQHYQQQLPFLADSDYFECF